MPACETDKPECLVDENGVNWRPIILQYRENGGIPQDQYDCLYKNYDSCTYGADPPVEGRDFINLKNFESYKINDQYHMKMVWSLGESVEWKQGSVYLFYINFESLGVSMSKPKQSRGYLSKQSTSNSFRCYRH